MTVRRILSGLLLCFSGAVSAIGGGVTEREIVVTNPLDGVKLAGTLSIPTGNRPRAAVVLASGSGQQNRDEEIMGRRPFKAIADYLGERGYAVLRMDDRGCGGSGGDFSAAVNADFVGDISAGLGYLDSLYESVPVGVIGHSEGGTTAIRVAVGHRQCDFIVTLAAPAWPGDSIIMSQGRAIAEAMSGKWEAERQQRMYLDIAKSDMPSFQARTAIYADVAGNLGESAKLPAVQNQLNAHVNVMVSPWYRDMLRYDPADDIRRVKVPWLALNGDKDMQVLPANFETIQGLNSRVKTVLLQGINHLMQSCATGLPQEYVTITEDISPSVLEAIAGWLDGVTAPPATDAF